MWANIRTHTTAKAAMFAAANSVPIVGVIYWDWNVFSLLFLYWVELVVGISIAATKSLFARRSVAQRVTYQLPLYQLLDKRGGITISSKLPPLYLRNIPHTVGVFGWLLVVWIVVGVVLLSDLGFEMAISHPTGIALAVVAMMPAQVHTVWRDYIQQRAYEEVATIDIAQVPARQTLILFLFLPLAGAIDAAPESGAVLVVVVALMKAGADLYGVWMDTRPESKSYLLDRIVATEFETEPPATLRVPDGEPETRVLADQRGVLAASVETILIGFISKIGLALLLIFVFGLAVRSWEILLLSGVAIGTIVAIHVATTYLVYGTIEYRRYGETLVAYDYVLETPQWVVHTGEIFSPTVENKIVDRICGTATISFNDGYGDNAATYTIAHVADISAVVDQLSLPIYETTVPDSNRTILVASIVLASVFLLLPIGLVAAPSVATGDAVAILIVLGPFLLFTIGILLVSGLSRI
ncbi:hypothetical protein HUB97_15145 [Halorubraceae archaeon YAN]|nr:hypothetical protein [Halorubraceae archaeon YAN]